ncbi:NADP(H)-dependent aldo-keto reductase [Thalassolituus sp.]|jgi:aryl-alcohol dehydrogenase-like predicted oxidoreductase|uniref:NADP(H)-dependent aldo-keto reductase n=1 Tax=Thalassolituus sp. TaxID=2030822 RepID=UPI0035181958
MRKNQLGNTDIQVSELCLGTMTWGEQNSEAEAHRQLDMAVDAGINFIDTAEMYPVPPKAETQGRTESCLGSWLSAGGRRDKLIIATKVTGPGDWMTHIRNGPDLSAGHIDQALVGSLERLRTDYIDLYQLHWPSRPTNFFGRLGYEHEAREGVPLEETLLALNKHLQAGTIRHYGLSNETAWGTMKVIALADQLGMPRPVSIQNPYNLLNRSYEVGLAEVSHREQCGLLAYSPLAFGVLSGKYLKNRRPEKARLTLFSRFSRYTGDLAEQATAAYAGIAESAGISPAQLALAFVNQRSFVTSNIIGATTEAQLQENLSSVDVRLSSDVMEAVEQVHRAISNPCP